METMIGLFVALLVSAPASMPAGQSAPATGPGPRTGPAIGQARPGRPATQPATRPLTRPDGQDPLLQQCRKIAGMVKLTEEQWKTVEANIDRLRQRQRHWQATSEAQVQALAAEVAQARKARDQAKIRRLAKKLKPLLAARGKIYGHDLDVIMSVLTKQQVFEYEAWGLYVTALRTYRNAGITEKQKPTIMQLCRKYAPLKLQAKTWRKKSAIRKQLLKTVLDEVLTEDQRITNEAYSLNQSAKWYFHQTKLTDDQKARIYEMCRRIGRKKLKATNWRQQAYLRRVLLRKVYDDVLTEKQRATARKPRPLGRPRAWPTTKSTSRPGGQRHGE